jgi:hypothetical protein
MAEINNPKKLMPTIFSTRTDHFSIRFLLVAPTACHSGPKFVKHTHPDPQRENSEFWECTSNPGVVTGQVEADWRESCHERYQTGTGLQAG